MMKIAAILRCICVSATATTPHSSASAAAAVEGIALADENTLLVSDMVGGSKGARTAPTRIVGAGRQDSRSGRGRKGEGE